MLARLISLPFLSVYEPTEARYAEIGRKMLATGNYITPFIADGVPFWAKPPLSFWATALSYGAFGVNTFAAHFPHFLFLLAAALVAYAFAKRRFGALYAAASLAILANCTFFLTMMGSVMTDPALGFTLALCMFSFYNAIDDNTCRSRFWGYMFFAGLGLALLAKGPLGIVIPGISIGGWTLARGKIRLAFERLPVFSGTLLMLAIAAPWYWLAEIRTPGFLHYFLIGEHFERYIIPHWGGDLYGSGRGGRIGAIWLYYLASVFPWPIYIIVRMFKQSFRREISSRKFLHDDFNSYMIAWVAMPILFFTFARNTLLAYALPAVIPSALLIARMVCREGRRLIMWIPVFFTAVNAALFATLAATYIAAPAYMDTKIESDHAMVAKYESARETEDTPLLYVHRLPNSAMFYSRGHLKCISAAADIEPYMDEGGPVFVVFEKSDPECRAALDRFDAEPVGENKYRAMFRLRRK